jgi:DNA-directed RNA polymerase subunit E'/Rpb7
MAQSRFQKRGQEQGKIYGVYIPSLLSMKVALSINEVGKNIKQNLERIISKQTEGRCIPEGYIRPKSVKVMTYSSGTVSNDKVEFQTTYECMVCHPVEGMVIECKTKTITKAGVHAEVIDETGAIPITAFIARDHHYSDKAFSEIRENMDIVVNVIGVRFELNDPYILVIGKLDTKFKQQNRLRRPGGNPVRENITIMQEPDEEFESSTLPIEELQAITEETV